MENFEKRSLTPKQEEVRAEFMAAIEMNIATLEDQGQISAEEVRHLRESANTFSGWSDDPVKDAELFVKALTKIDISKPLSDATLRELSERRTQETFEKQSSEISEESEKTD